MTTAKPEEKEEARRLRINGLSVNAIARELGVSKGSVSLWIRGLPVPAHLTEEGRAGRKKLRLEAIAIERERLGIGKKKERLISSDGRWMLQVPPGYQGRTYIGGRYIFEHRYIMEQHLGRLLEPGEVVHHLNGNKLDNRLENLELIQGGSAHLKRHVEDSPLLQLVCSNCGAEFSRRSAVYKRSGKSHTFCTKACHQEFYHKLYRKTPRKVGINRVPRHGTANEYSYHKCRCDLCREAQRLKIQRWKEKRK
jgi:transposase-like protein